jgi:aryl-alcohol dehydrogenase-like predicted oxidoreductase
LPPFLAPAREKLIGFHRRLAEHALTPLQAAIAFPLSLAEVDKVVVGVTSPAELGEIVAAANATREAPWPAFAVDDDILLDPRKWQPR